MEEPENQNRMNGNHYKRNHHIGWWIVGIIVAIVVIICALGAWKYSSVKNAVDKAYDSAGIKKQRDTETLLNNRKPISILLMGTDTGELHRNYKGRTDSMMVITINPQKNTTTMTSIPRDTAVKIPGYPQYSPAKINAAYAYGSSKTAIETVQKMLNIPIDYYATINMRGMKQIVDRVGGVDVAPQLSFKYEGYTFKKGQNTHMNGSKALAYSRMRYDDPRNDYGRQQRQRQVLQAIVTKSNSVSTLLNQGFIDSISKNCKTDLTFGDMTKIAEGYLSARKNIKDYYIDGQHSREIQDQEMQVTPQSELQKTSNEIRDNLGLKHKPVGHIALN